MHNNRCPYCVDGNEFKLMAQRMQGSRTVFFLCKKCRHIAKPGDETFDCPCAKCCETKLSVSVGSGYAH